jgi:HSP20 family protein
MPWNTSLLPAGSPFVALRKDFERQLGLETSPAFAGMTVTEHADRWTVSVDVPGVAESDISITFHDGSLIVEGERKAQLTEGAKELFSDRSFSKFRRVLKVREAVDQNNIDASLVDGVLTLVLHRTPETVPAKIVIRTSAGQPSLQA